MARSEKDKKKQDALSLRHVQDPNCMNRQEEDVRIEDEISKQMVDISTKSLKKTKDMDTFERKAQEIRLKKPLSPTTLGYSLIGTVKAKSKSKPVSNLKTKKEKSLDSTSSPADKPKFRTVTETLSKGGTPFLKRKKRVRAVRGSDTYEEREVTT